MERQYLTVKEFARECNCSTQYVYRLLQTKLQPYVVLIDGKKHIDIKALEVVFKDDATNQETNFATKVANQVDNPSSSAIEEELKRINERNEKLIDEMREEIKAKDAQLSQLNEKVISLFETNQRLMENNQQLQLNYQMLLGAPEEKNIVEVDEEGARVVEEPQEPQKKKGLFSWLFG